MPMRRPITISDIGRHAGRGFSLVELMIAIGIFAIGAIAVASLFPVAILLQKQTMQDTTARTFAENARAMVLARGFSGTALAGVNDTTPTVTAVPNALNDWSLYDRSYLSGVTLPNRRIFWVPLFMDNNAAPAQREWMVYLFVVKRNTRSDYSQTGPAADWANQSDGADNVPGVRRVNATINGNRFDFVNGSPPQIRIGDKVLDARGRDWIVTGSDSAGIQINSIIPGNGTTIDIWYAHPGNSGTSSFVSLITLKDIPGDNNLIR
jgi:prepilin-type N-terminal cleavage/methylation domain-containing protein